MENKELYKGFLTSMRGITSSVNIISSQSEGKKHAMTASSVASLSLDPPSMLICVNKQASIHKILGPDKFFCINVLAKDQSDLANLCSSSEEGDARFNDVHWSYDEEAHTTLHPLLIYCVSALILFSTPVTQYFLEKL